MRLRSALIVLTALAGTLAAGTAAGASTAGRSAPTPGAAAPAQPPMPGPGLPGPVKPGFAAASSAGRVLDDVFNSDSCTTQPDNPAIKSTCTAVGYFADGPYVAGLLEYSDNGRWASNTFGGVRTVTDPIEVSCVPQQSDIPVCVAVGEDYNNQKYPRQLVATGGDNGMSPVAYNNPKGATWSWLGDVSCRSARFCLMVGAAGTTRRTTKGLRYLSHANAYRWTGSRIRRLTVPAPAHARATELSGVSCASTRNCLAVGNYTNARGRQIPYSALWANGAWHVRATPGIRRKAETIYQGVSCPAPGNCVAVGVADGPGSTAFAERYTHGKWAVMRIAARRRSAFYGVSCPARSRCVAVGRHQSKSLIEAWNGSKWAAQAVPATVAPLTTDGLLHVSCVTTAICTAVGYRHNPAIRYAYHTLALGWNGKSWVIQKTRNE